MAPIFSTVLFLTIVIFASLAGSMLYNLHRQNKMKRWQLIFEQVAADFGLSISTQQVIDNIFIGLDQVSNKLLFLDISNNKQRKYLIDLKQVKGISVVTTYAPISKNSNKSREIVQTVSLEFDCKNEDKILLIPFYDLTIDHHFELEDRTAKAKEWKTRLSKILINNGYFEQKYKRHGSDRVQINEETNVLTRTISHGRKYA